MGVAGSFLWGTGSYMQESAEVSVPASQVTLTRKGSTFRPQADTPLTELTTVKTRLDDSQRQLPAVQGRTEAEKGAASDLESLRAENSALQEKFATLQTRERESCEATERSKQEATTYRNNLLKVREENRRLRKRLQQGQEGHHSRSTQNTTQSRRNSANGTGQQSKLSGKSRESLIKSKSPSGHHSRVGPPGDQQRRSEQRGRTPGSMAPQLVERSETSDEIDDEGYATADVSLWFCLRQVLTGSYSRQLKGMLPTFDPLGRRSLKQESKLHIGVVCRRRRQILPMRMRMRMRTRVRTMRIDLRGLG